MTIKLKSLLVLLAMLVGAVNGAWAQTSYEFYNDGNLQNTSYFFGWNGNTYTYNSLQLITCMANNNYLTIPKAAELRNENWIEFTLDAAATIYVGVYVNSNGNKSFKFNKVETKEGNVVETEKVVNINENEQGAYEIIEIDNVLPGTYRIKKNSDNVGVYYVRVTKFSGTYNNTYPYIWDFTNWTSTSEELKKNGNIWDDGLKYKQNLNVYEGVTLIYDPVTYGTHVDLPETKGLMFYSTGQRLSVNPNNYLSLYSTTVIIPNVPKGYDIKIMTAKTPSAGISVNGAALSSINDGNNLLFTYNNANTTTSNVRLDFGGSVSNIMQVYSISVTKGEVPEFVVNGNDLYIYDSSNAYIQVNNANISTNILAIPYDSSHPYIRFKVNMEESQDPDWTGSIAGSAFTITNSTNTSVISINDPAVTSERPGTQGNRVYIKGAKINGIGTTELTFLFAGNNIYRDKIIKATVTVYDNDHPYIAFSKTTDTYDLVTMNYTEPVLTVLPTSLASSVVYSSDYPSIAIPDNTSNPKGNLMIVNTGVVNITAAVTYGGQTYSASYELTIKAEEAVWDIQNGNELYFPTRNNNSDALKNNPYNNNTGKLLVRKVTSIPHMTMEFGDVSNSNMAMVAIRNDVRAANMIDQNGWQHAWLNYDNSDWLMKPNQGTFYKFVPSISGNLTIKGVRSHNGSGANIVVLVDKDLVTTGDWDTHVANGTRTRYSVVTTAGGNTTTVNYYSYPIVQTLNFENDNAYAVTEESVTLIGGHTYYLYAVTPNTSGTRTINRDVTPNTDESTVGDWQNFYLSGFVFETPDFKFNKKNVVMGTTGVTAPGYNRIPQSTSYQQTINDETTVNSNITYEIFKKGDIADSTIIDSQTGRISKIGGHGAIVVTATFREPSGGTSKTSYVLTVPYTTIGDGGSKSWVFNWENYNYNGGNPTGTNKMEQVDILRSNAPASEWSIQYKVRRYDSGTDALNYINVPVLANALDVSGDNARYIGTTAGLLFNADANTFGTTTSVIATEYKSESVGDGVGKVSAYKKYTIEDGEEIPLMNEADAEGGVTYLGPKWVELKKSADIDIALKALLNYDASDAVDPCNYLTMENGTSMTIPNLKAGQHVRIKWARYSPGNGEKMRVTNLKDLATPTGTLITKAFPIGAGVNVDRNGGTGYHEFVVAENGDVTFTLDQIGWTNIYKIDVSNDFIPTDLMLESGTALMRKSELGTTLSNTYSTSWGVVQSQSTTGVSYAIKNSPAETRTGTLTTENCYIDSDNKTLKVGSGGHGRFILQQNGYVTSYKEDNATADYLLDQKETVIKVYEYDYSTKSYPYTWNLENMSSATATALYNDSTLVNSGSNYKIWTKADNEKYKLTLEPENLISWSTKSSIGGSQTAINELDGLGVRPADITKSNTIILGSNNTGIELPSAQNAEIITVPEVASKQYVYIRVKKGNNANIDNIEAKAISKGVTTDRTGYIETVYDNGSYAVYKLEGGGKVSDGDINTLEFYLKDVTVMQVAVSKDTKTITSAGYATEARDYNLDFSLNETLTGNGVTAYKVTGVDGTHIVLGNVTPYFPAKQDNTDMVKTDHTSWGGTGMAGTWAAPAVTTSDGRNSNMAESYNSSTAGVIGTILSQTVSNLANGTYDVELYANAFFTPNRAIADSVADGTADVAYVFANNEKQYLPCTYRSSTNENGLYQFTVEITDGTLNLGLYKEKKGTNWHSIQIKRLAKHKAQGVLLKGNAGDYPLFTWDVNRTSSEMSGNRLIGVPEVTNDTPVLPQKDANGNYNYILTNHGALIRYVYNNDDDNIDNTTGTQTGTVDGLGFYLVIKAGTILSDGPYVAEKPNVNTAYLQLDGGYLKEHATPDASSPVRQFFFIDKDDESTIVKSVKDSGSSVSTDDDGYYSLQGIRMDNPGKGIYLKGGKKIIIK